MSAALHLPGRLGSPDLTLADDPRADPRMIAAMAPFGMAAGPGPLPVGVDSPLDDLREFVAGNEAGFAAVVELLTAELPEIDGVERWAETITAPAGHEITLHIHAPAERTTALPGIVHLHGGAMAMFAAAWPNYRRWRDALAARGLIVVGVEFRNAAGALGAHPFPAGLDDCTAAVRWVSRERDRLGIGGLVLSGESGGGNLALAAALRASRGGYVHDIDGVYAQCPYISGAYADPPTELTSLAENDGYFLGSAAMTLLAKVYDPTGQHATDPLAWPYRATPADVAGLPPHVVSVNELDPLRDEGLTYCRTLQAAGVEATSRVVAATCHSADCLFEVALPDTWNASLDDIAQFAARAAGTATASARGVR